jgi:hypothetical protein
MDPAPLNKGLAERTAGRPIRRSGDLRCPAAALASEDFNTDPEVARSKDTGLHSEEHQCLQSTS